MALRLLNAVPASSFETLPLEQARAQIDAEAWVFGKRTEVGRVEDLSIPTPEGSVPARRYDPREDGPGRAVLVYFHGGGFVLGGLESADSVCRFLCARANITVLAVDYRLAPEHPFPAAPDDALAAYRWAVQQAPGWGIGPDRVMLGPVSARRRTAPSAPREPTRRRPRPRRARARSASTAAAVRRRRCGSPGGSR